MVSVTAGISREVDFGNEICYITWATLPSSDFRSYSLIVDLSEPPPVMYFSDPQKIGVYLVSIDKSRVL